MVNATSNELKKKLYSKKKLYVHGASAAFNCKKDILTHTEYIKVLAPLLKTKCLSQAVHHFYNIIQISHQTSSRINTAQVFHRKSLRIIKPWGKNLTTPSSYFTKVPYFIFLEDVGRKPCYVRIFTHFANCIPSDHFFTTNRN